MTQLYQEHIMDHYRNPRNQGLVGTPSFYSFAHNALCGDSVEVSGIVVGLRLVKVGFRGKGCVISQAAASLFCQAMEGKLIPEIMRTGPDDVTKLVGIELGPVRLKCALLVREALHTGILGMNQ